MLKTLSLASISALLLAACIIDTDDGNNDTSGNTTATSQTASTTNNTSAGTGESTDGTTASTTVSASSESSADSTAADSSTGAGSACGWGATGEKTTPMGYVCGGDGPDPDDMIVMDCASYGLELMEGGDCGGNMGITGAGCCDENGDVWYCADDAGMPRLFTEDC